MKKLYVGNLSFSAQESEIREMFSEFGNVSDVKIITDRETGRSRGFAFVEMSNDSEANAAMQAMNGKDVGGRALVVNEAREREARGGGGGGGGGSRGGGGGGGRRDRW
jgi:RNA recognition motif-containing protein